MATAVHLLVERRQAGAEVRDAIDAALERIHCGLLGADLGLEPRDQFLLCRERDFEMLGFGRRFAAQSTELDCVSAQSVELTAKPRRFLLRRVPLLRALGEVFLELFDAFRERGLGGREIAGGELALLDLGVQRVDVLVAAFDAALERFDAALRFQRVLAG